MSFVDEFLIQNSYDLSVSKSFSQFPSHASDVSIVDDKRSGILRIMNQSFQYLGEVYHIGDYIAVKGRNSDHYFGMIRQLFLSEYGQKFFSMNWLIPKISQHDPAMGIKSFFSPADFEVGSLHQAIESMDCVVGVIYSKFY